MSITIDMKNNIACVKVVGQVEYQEMVDTFDRIVNYSDYKKGTPRLWDLREADLSHFSASDIESLTRHSSKYATGINDVKVAFVADKPLEYGLSRMFELHAQHSAKTPVKVFKTVEPAEEWLNGRQDMPA